jgi:hypothetical protein
MNSLTTIRIKETEGIERINEPMTMGISFSKGFLREDIHNLVLADPLKGQIPFQTQVLAKWSDGSSKWVLFDFQTSVAPGEEKYLLLSINPEKGGTADAVRQIKIKEDLNHIQIETGCAEFFINKNRCKPFDRVVLQNTELVDGIKSNILLTDEEEVPYEPQVKTIFFETKGPLRSTLKVEGVFQSEEGNPFCSFFARIHFFSNSSMVKMDFTILNPKAAIHPGGLWDLGDPGSIFFHDLSIHTALNSKNKANIFWKAQPNASFTISDASHISVYQDSSGGENWKSENHVNRHNEVRHSFKGYKVSSDGTILSEGERSSPILSIGDGEKLISGAVQHFWQNFPKTINAEDNALIFSLFPRDYDDLFELQGGEQKTHTIYFRFSRGEDSSSELDWIHTPLIPCLPPQWYSDSNAFPYLLPEKENPNTKLTELLSTAVKGDYSLFARREIIDEYGWRNFGEFYADHEAVGRKDDELFISHYNNQYDCIYGAIAQFATTGNPDWFVLVDQLCRHVKDIDIYHTDADRPEYNHGLFWHTEHHIEARTATHRCFSKRHGEDRDLSIYGGGPSLSHVYATGLLYHHYMTGNSGSKETVEELAAFVLKNIDMNTTLSRRFINTGKKLTKRAFNLHIKDKLVDLNKVYGVDGPGRASGNSLSVLLDAFVATGGQQYLNGAESLIRSCIAPGDDIEKRDLLDVENRWMYTVFLQAIGKYLEIKFELGAIDACFEYARKSLIRYAEWMVENEYPYLQNPENLEFPNETWAVQDIRKTNVLIFAAKYADNDTREKYSNKAKELFNNALRYLFKYETRNFTRPLALLMQNAMNFAGFQKYDVSQVEYFQKGQGKPGKKKATSFIREWWGRKKISPIDEWQYIKWRLK